jgi:SAM-dependent methyltransferase
MDKETIAYYRQSADLVADRYESIVNGMAPCFEQAFAAGSRVLDVGCGSGRDMAHLLRMGRDAYGLDATPELVERAQQLHPELRGRIVLDALPDARVPFGGNFDGVLCSAVLMHLPSESLPAAVKFLNSCLRPGGSLLYSVPSKRLDVASSSHRDVAGRLFIPNAQGHLGDLLQTQGFRLIDQWRNADSLGRDEVEWTSVWMTLGEDAHS